MTNKRYDTLVSGISGDANKLSRLLKSKITVEEIEFLIRHESHTRSRERILRRLVGKKKSLERASELKKLGL